MTLLSNVKFFKWKIFSNFVSFSECPYFNECACYWFVLRTFVFTVQCGVLNVRLYEGQSFVILDICKHRDTFCDSYKIPSYLFSKVQNWCAQRPRIYLNTRFLHRPILPQHEILYPIGLISTRIKILHIGNFFTK